MMNRIIHLVAIIIAVVFALTAVPAKSDFTFTEGSGASAFSFTSGTGSCSGVHCFASVPIDTAGAQLFATGNAGYVQFPSAQAVTQSGTWTVQPGNTANTTPWLATINQGGNSAAVTTAGADGVSNTLSGLAAYSRSLMFNGTTWDRLIGDTTSGVWVNVKAATGLAQGSTTSGQTGSLVMGAVTTAAPAYTTAQTSPVSIRTDGAQRVGLYAGAEGGCTGGTDVTDASTNANVIKASAGTLCQVDIQNPDTTLYYISFYNVATGPTCNSDTIIRQQIIPPASAAGQVGGIVISLGAYGQAFTTGIGYCITAAAAGTGNAAANIRLNYAYK